MQSVKAYCPRKLLIFRNFDKLSERKAVLFFQANNLDTEAVKNLRLSIRKLNLDLVFIKNSLFAGWAKSHSHLWATISKILAGQTMVIHGDCDSTQLRNILSMTEVPLQKSLFFIAGKVEENIFTRESLNQLCDLKSEKYQVSQLLSILQGTQLGLNNLLTHQTSRIPMILQTKIEHSKQQ